MIHTTQTWKIGDCLELMREMPEGSVDMILCDLPYGTTACSWDTIIPFEPLWAGYTRIIKDTGAVVLTASQPFTSMLVMSNLEMFRYELIWHKNFSGGFATAKFQPMKYHENILVFYKHKPTYNPQFENYADSVKKRFKEGERVNTDSQQNQSTNKIHNGFGSSEHSISFIRGKYPSSVQTIVGVENANGVRLHPTQKPVTLFEHLIKTYTNEGDWVHDSCLGSGTTLEACRKTNRNCIGFEISDEWEKHYADRAMSHTPTLQSYMQTGDKQP